MSPPLHAQGRRHFVAPLIATLDDMGPIKPLLVVLPTVLAASGGAADCNSLLDTLRASFKYHNSTIETVYIQDIEPRASTYWVLARGIRADETFAGSLDDELFGVFIVAGDLVELLDLVALFPTKRWNDFEVWIEDASLEQIVVKGRGATYGDSEYQETYKTEY